MEWILGLIGLGIVIAVAAWMWKDKNADKAVRVVDVGYEAAHEAAKKVAEEAKAAVKKAKAKK